MSDFINEFWSIYIGVLTVISILGCGILLWAQSSVKIDTPASPDGRVPTTGHSWDDGLTELNNPMPRWWMWLFYITIVFGLAYLVLYTGLGSFKGKLGWDSSGQYQTEVQKADTEYGPLFSKYQQQDIKMVAAAPQARAMGERLFMTYCAQCHGSNARGSKGFPNLADKDWLYGGAPEVIKASIMEGRHGRMPLMGAAVGSDKDVENVAHYVLSLSNSAMADPIKSALGKSKYSACIACHGANGQGNTALGAPNLSDKIWLYGGSPDAVMEAIRKGRSNSMPAFKDFLGEPKVHVLSAYVWGLSNPVDIDVVRQESVQMKETKLSQRSE